MGVTAELSGRRHNWKCVTALIGRMDQLDFYELPEGWTMKYHGVGADRKPYFINHATKTTTWVDPRIEIMKKEMNSENSIPPQTTVKTSHLRSKTTSSDYLSSQADLAPGPSPVPRNSSTARPIEAAAVRTSNAMVAEDSSPQPRNEASIEQTPQPSHQPSHEASHQPKSLSKPESKPESKPATQTTFSSLAKGPNPNLYKGPNPALLRTDRVVVSGPDPTLRHDLRPKPSGLSEEE